MIDMITSFLSTDIRMATSLLIAALGLVYCSRAGIVNIGVEGMMLIGSLMGVVGSYYTGSALMGALVAIGVNLIVSLVFAFFAVTIKADQNVIGTAINTFATGLTVTVNRVIFGVGTSQNIAVFDRVAIPGLSKIPIIGEAVFNQAIPVYIALIAVPVLWFILMKTSLGLKIRSVGENPQACDTVGINVYRVRYGTILFSGALAGLAGAYVSMGQLSSFTEDMIAGRGFIALAAVVLGNYMPGGVLAATLIFGAASALQYRMQATAVSVPYQFWLMLPYIITIIAICMYRKSSNQAASSGKPYDKH